MGYTHYDKVSGETGLAVGVKGSEIVVADSSGWWSIISSRGT
jgi:hypothetical protein